MLPSDSTVESQQVTLGNDHVIEIKNCVYLTVVVTSTTYYANSQFLFFFENKQIKF